MKAKEYRNKIRKKYKPGQIINLRFRADDRKKIMERAKTEIIKFYPHIILCLVDGKHKESFTYQELDNLTTY